MAKGFDITLPDGTTYEEENHAASSPLMDLRSHPALATGPDLGENGYNVHSVDCADCHAPEPPEITAELPDWVQEGDVLIIDVQRAGHGIIDSYEMRVVLDGDRLRAEDMRPDVVEVEPL